MRNPSDLAERSQCVREPLLPEPGMNPRPRMHL